MSSCLRRNKAQYLIRVRMVFSHSIREKIRTNPNEASEKDTEGIIKNKERTVSWFSILFGFGRFFSLFDTRKNPNESESSEKDIGPNRNRPNQKKNKVPKAVDKIQKNC